jgi:hypothetical protein
MNKLKINRKYSISPDEIEKLVIKKGEVYVHRKKGYPKILKTTEGITLFKKRLTNLYLTLKNFEVEYEN